MPEGRVSTSTRMRLTMAVVALAAACALFAAPWTRIAPLSSGLSVWMESVLPGWAKGTVIMSFRDTPTSVGSLAARLIPLSILFALPFLTISRSLVGRDGVVIGRLAGVFILSLAIPALFRGEAGAMGALRAGGILILAGSAFLGSLLLALGYRAFRTGREVVSLCRQTLGLLVGLAGACLASILLLPVGLILLIPAYLLLAICHFAST